MNKKSISEFFHVLAIIFPLTLIIPNLMQPLLDHWKFARTKPLGILLIDTVIVACAVFTFLPWLKKLTSKFFS